jgi:L-aspartate oxidase
VRATPSIKLLEGLSAEEIVLDRGTVIGLRARESATGATWTIPARAIVLATGGAGHLYAVTTNPPESCGIGLAIAARAGAVVADPEFVQFHPTALDIGRDPAPLATEAIRGEGATLINSAGHRFMQDLHPDAELGPRDIVARGVFTEIAAGRGAFLDAREAIGEKFAERFPTVAASCQAAGINPAYQPMPVVPAQHYHMGGVKTDERGRTSLAGLWAIGEVASTGAHGANRLASNSLLEAVVFAARAATDISENVAGAELPPASIAQARTDLPDESDPELSLRSIMSVEVGVVRTGVGLSRALAKITRIEREARTPRLRNMATAALLIAAAAFARPESRGGHYRADFPTPDPAQAKRTVLTLADARRIAVQATEPELAPAS